MVLTKSEKLCRSVAINTLADLAYLRAFSVGICEFYHSYR